MFFAIVLGAVGLTQAQMAFPDVAKASGASLRVFTIIDRQPLIQDGPAGAPVSCLGITDCITDFANQIAHATVEEDRCLSRYK